MTDNSKDLEQKSFYSEIKYPGPRSTLTYLWAKRILKYFNKEEVFTLLDAGCGIGANIFYYSKKHPNAKFVGINYLKKRIKYAKNLNKNPNVDFFVDSTLPLTLQRVPPTV